MAAPVSVSFTGLSPTVASIVVSYCVRLPVTPTDSPARAAAAHSTVTVPTSIMRGGVFISSLLRKNGPPRGRRLRVGVGNARSRRFLQAGFVPFPPQTVQLIRSNQFTDSIPPGTLQLRHDV